MPQGIVDAFESIQIQEHQGGRLATPAASADHMVQPVPEQLPVRQPREWIVECQPMQFRLGRLELGQIPQAEHNTINARHRQHGGKGTLHIPPLSLGVANTDPDHRHLLAR